MTSCEALFSDSTLVLVVTGLICAVVRWFHMCPTYSDKAAVYYPARKNMSFFFALNVFFLPYVLKPSDPLVMRYVSSVGLIFVALAVPVLYRMYFRWDLNGNPFWRKGIKWLAFSWMVILLFCLVIFPGYFSSYVKWFDGVTALLGVCLTLMAADTVFRLRKDIDLYDSNNYSNPEDFPLKFARRVLYLPLFFILAGWALFLTDNLWLNFALDIVCSVAYVWLLCVILYPQEGRALPVVQVNDFAPPQQVFSCTRGSVEDEVLTIIQQRFREPHLLKSEVLADVSRGNAQRADRFIVEHGYYRLVNMFRLEYARLYKKKHPESIQDLVAFESGFTSRVTFYKAKKSVGDIYPEVSSRVAEMF